MGIEIEFFSKMRKSMGKMNEKLTNGIGKNNRCFEM